MCKMKIQARSPQFLITLGGYFDPQCVHCKHFQCKKYRYCLFARSHCTFTAFSAVSECYSGATVVVDRLNSTGRFLDLCFDLYSLYHLCYRKYVLILIEALICGYLEPKKLRARPQNKAITPP